MMTETISGQNRPGLRAYWKCEERILLAVSPPGRQGMPGGATANAGYHKSKGVGHEQTEGWR